MTGEYNVGARARILQWLRIKSSLWKFAAPTICNGFLSLICYVIGWHLSSKVDKSRFNLTFRVYSVGHKFVMGCSPPIRYRMSD